MPRKLTTTEQAARDAHFAEFSECWLCRFMRRKQTDRTELHHTAGRGKKHECRENFAALCTQCHCAIQGRRGAELVCLVLKKQYDPEHYSPQTICELRGRAVTCWTDNDVEDCRILMEMMREAMR